MAGGSSRSDDGKKKARIEIIPLIDVVFFLLATFVLFTLSLNKLQTVPLNLPVANPSPQPPDPDTVNLQVSDAQTYYWNQELVTLNELRPKLDHYKTQVAVPRVLIYGDDKAKFGAAVAALDIIRKAGIEQVSVRTDRTMPTGK